MPFELRGNCVHKTGDDAPIKCHETHEEAVAHLAALQANVEDATESINLYQSAAFRATENNPPLTGKSWNVTIIGPNSPDDIVTVGDKKYLKSKNNRLYDLAGLEASVEQGLWHGVQVFDNHLTDDEFRQRQGMRSADTELLGAIVDPIWDAETSSIKGTYQIIKDDLSKKILNAHDAGILDIFGLSIDTKPIYGDDIQVDNKFLPVVAGIEKATSIDLVSKPAAGGRFNHVLASENNTQERGNSREVEAMNEEEVKALVGQAIVDALNAKEEEKRIKAEEEEAERLRLEAEEAERLAAENEAEEDANNDSGPDVVPAAQVEELEAKFQALECQSMLRDKLIEAKLSEASQGIIKQAFAGRIFEAKELDEMIKVTKKAEIANDPTGRATESGNQREIIRVGQDDSDKATLAFMRLIMGNTDFRNLEHNQDLAVIDRIPEAYNVWKRGDKRLDRTPRLSEWLYNLVGGNPLIDERASEAVTTSSMSSIVKNAVNLMIANDYSKREKWWEPIVRTEEVDTIDQATLIRIYGLNTLDVVDEGGAYTELDWADQEETPTFVKRGNYVGVTIEAMLRDKVQAIRTLPARLANSWFNSISLRVAAVFTNNSNTGPVLSDTGALFNATATSTTGGHANLLTTALSFTSFDAAYTAMLDQTDQVEGAGAKLGMENAPKFLLVPTNLRATALQIRNSEQLPGSANNDINPHFQNFEVIVVPRWTDTNDWALVADPMVTPSIWLIFLTGNTVPSIFTADNEASGAMFTNDQLRWKVRQMTYRFSATYDNAPVSDFRGLHKSNVA
jgi:hypothetical protein